MEHDGDTGVVPESAHLEREHDPSASGVVPEGVVVEHDQDLTPGAVVPQAAALVEHGLILNADGVDQDDNNDREPDLNEDSQGGDSNEAEVDETSQDSQETSQDSPEQEQDQNMQQMLGNPSNTNPSNQDAIGLRDRQDSVEGPQMNINPFSVDDVALNNQDAEVPNLGEDVDDNSQMSDVGRPVDLRPSDGLDTEESQLSSQVQHVETQVQQGQAPASASSSSAVQEEPQPGPSTSAAARSTTRAQKRKERPGKTTEELDSIVEESKSKKHKSADKAKKLLQKLLAGTPVKSHVRRAGQYLIGPKLGISPVKCIEHCLGRRDGTDRYYLLKILHLGIGTKETQVCPFRNVL